MRTHIICLVFPCQASGGSDQSVLSYFCGHFLFFSFSFCFCSCVPGASSPMSRSASPVGERAQETADTGFTEAQLAAITSVVRGVLKESQGPCVAEEGGGAGEALGSRSDGVAVEWGREAGRWVESTPAAGIWQEVQRASRAGPDGCVV